jgi:hypothetical protein
MQLSLLGILPTVISEPQIVCNITNAKSRSDFEEIQNEECWPFLLEVFLFFIRTAEYDGNKEGIPLDSNNSKHKQHDL